MANLSRRKRRQISPHSERCSMSMASGAHMPAAPTPVAISEPAAGRAQPQVDLGLGLEVGSRRSRGLAASRRSRRLASVASAHHGEVVLAGADVRVVVRRDQVAGGPVPGPHLAQRRALDVAEALPGRRAAGVEVAAAAAARPGDGTSPVSTTGRRRSSATGSGIGTALTAAPACRGAWAARRARRSRRARRCAPGT